MIANAIKILATLLMALTLTSCSKECKPEIVVKTEYVPQIVTEVVVTPCKIDTPVCEKLPKKLDEQLYSSIKCIVDLKMYIKKCNEEIQ